MPVIIALGRQRQTDCMLQANLGSRPMWVTQKRFATEKTKGKKDQNGKKKVPVKPAKKH